jgi:hypothetical protein
VTPAQTAAFDAARAATLRRHQYRTNNESMRSTCACGLETTVHDIGVHIEQAAQQAGLQAAAETTA